MRLRAACARLRRAELLEEGDSIERARKKMIVCGVHSPERWAAIYAPGYTGISQGEPRTEGQIRLRAQRGARLVNDLHQECARDVDRAGLETRLGIAGRPTHQECPLLRSACAASSRSVEERLPPRVVAGVSEGNGTRSRGRGRAGPRCRG